MTNSMNIRVDGDRSTSENWLIAHRTPLEELPAITDQEEQAADRLGLTAEDYRRSKYAGDLTRVELAKRAQVVGNLVSGWLHQHGVVGKVSTVWLKTLEGKFRMDVEGPEGWQHIFLNEDLVDDLLDGGSREAHENLERLLSANFGIQRTAKAS